MCHNTFVIILEADVTRLDDLGQIHMESAFSGVLFRDLGSFRFQVGSEFRGLSTGRAELLYAPEKGTHKNRQHPSYSFFYIMQPVYVVDGLVIENTMKRLAMVCHSVL